VLDEKLTKRRLIQEARCIFKCRKAGVSAPCIFMVDEDKGHLVMERINGPSIKQYLYDYNPGGALARKQYACVYVYVFACTCVHVRMFAYVRACVNTYSDVSYLEGKIEPIAIATQIGISIARLHDSDVVHGDLTTSNMMIENDTNRLVMIDFGLASSQPLPEDKAVDLYVLERAFSSTHPNSQPLVDEVIHSYAQNSKKSKAVMQKLNQVRLRGRKRTAFG